MKDYIKHDVSNDKFYIEGEKKNKGHATYVIKNGVMDINSTYVDPAHRNQGYAKELVDAAVEYAKSKDLKLDPSCSYAVLVVQAHYKDMLA